MRKTYENNTGDVDKKIISTSRATTRSKCKSKKKNTTTGRTPGHEGVGVWVEVPSSPLSKKKK